MNAVRVPIGSLAQRLYKAERELIDSERQLEQMLSSLYGSWSDWEVGPDGIDVFDVVDSPAATSTLWRAGFASVRSHDHARTRFRYCGCPIQRSLL